MEIYDRRSNTCTTRDQMINGIIKDLLESRELNSSFILILRNLDYDNCPSLVDPENYVLECIDDDLIAYSKLKFPNNTDMWL